jgi:biopolymer transport protein ExbD
MKLESPAPIRKPLPLTPLVDVVFLLLMFFMLSSTFTKYGHIGLLLGRTVQPAAGATAASPGVIVRVGAGPTMVVNGKTASLEALTELLDSFSDRGVESAVVQAAADASVQDLVDVLERARASRLSRVVVAK